MYSGRSRMLRLRSQKNLSMTDPFLAILCRGGFEAECAQEGQALAARDGIATYARTERNLGYVEFPLPDETSAKTQEFGHWRHHLFARSCLHGFARFNDLPREDRLTPLLGALGDATYADVWAESPDTDAGNALTRLRTGLGNALVSALKRERRLDARAKQRLHLFIPRENEYWLATSRLDTGAPWPQGIPRLKFPSEAPSRSTLKLDEAFLTLLDEGERTRWLQPGMTAVDLGAAPGGWTYQFVRRGMRVNAVDNGPMGTALMDSGLVTHLREDGFRYKPAKPVDWMVCDMVEQPRRVAERMAQWLAEGWCKRSIFNLKLPMKKRYAEVQLCFEVMREAMKANGQDLDLRAKQLYHDREEITVFASPTSQR